MSTKTIAEKLLIKPGTTYWTDEAHATLIGPLPAGASRADGLGAAAVGVIFAADAASARRELDTHRAELAAPQVLWVAYPKGGRADINRDSLWPIVTEYGLRPNGQVAIDDTWSALRFRPDRPGEAPFTGGKS
ncbi:hypothetical protein CS0771_39250 [Catellatospora sp. IY07-71]|uniref:hypothetical protein n=1 Tax=Catellatospora sp. IY07-71 TaxID=2728827 RepID=UPI001BB2F277|nr:hypothetical protein [Catellatospora sp. IY07-71]BCJ74381.1 hypothetical protein CS0771_39250 [Catellatospora sp. IY07-71]